MAGPNLSGWTSRTITPLSVSNPAVKNAKGRVVTPASTRTVLNDSSLGSRQPGSGQTGTPIATQSTFAPLQNSALFNLGQNQSMSFFQSLLSALGGGMAAPAAAPAASVLHPAQANAIDFARQMIGQENWQREREASIRAFEDPRSRSGFVGVSPLSAPMGGGTLPVQNPVINQFLSTQRLMPAVTLGAAAAAHGSGGFAMPMGSNNRSGWTSPGFGF